VIGTPQIGGHLSAINRRRTQAFFLAAFFAVFFFAFFLAFLAIDDLLSWDGSGSRFDTTCRASQFLSTA